MLTFNESKIYPILLMFFGKYCKYENIFSDVQFVNKKCLKNNFYEHYAMSYKFKHVCKKLN